MKFSIFVLAVICLTMVFHTGPVEAQKKGSVTVDINKNGRENPRATVGAQYPVIDKKNTKLHVGGSSTFQRGSKPNHNVGVTFEHRFK